MRDKLANNIIQLKNYNELDKLLKMLCMFIITNEDKVQAEMGKLKVKKLQGHDIRLKKQQMK